MEGMMNCASFYRAMQVYLVHFTNGTKLSLTAYNQAQARMLAQETIPFSSIASVTSAEAPDR